MSVRDIAWRGARPLQQGDLLFGRDAELAEFINKCQSYDIITLSAASGVGKSSFIRAAAIPRLDEVGARVFANTSWSRAVQSIGASDPLDRDVGRKLYCAALDINDPDLDLPGDDDRVPIVILDQFEECLRYNEQLGRSVLEFAAGAARRLELTHVIIVRSEYRWQLRPVESRDSWWHLELSEITDRKALHDIVTRPATDAGVAVEPAVVDKIVDGWWSSARFRVMASAGRQTPVGLLHLQSMLWLLQRWFIDEDLGDETTITLAHLAEFYKGYGGEEDDDGASLISEAMIQYVSRTVDYALGGRCEQLRDHVPPKVMPSLADWPLGPKIVTARAARYLSTAGYKIPQSFATLLSLALSEDIEADSARLIGSAATDNPRALAARMQGLQAAGVASTEHWPTNPDDDPSRTSLAEVLAWCLKGALDVLSDPRHNILRTFTREGDAIYELVHDGLGSAIESWAHDFLGQTIAAVDLVTARTGRPMRRDITPEALSDRFSGSDDWSSSLALTGTDPPRVALRHLAWIGNNIVDAVIARTDFVGCDLTGSVLQEVTVEDVRFEGCVLRGVYARDLTARSVRFTAAGGQRGGYDTLVIDGVDGGTVDFEDMPGTTGLFLYRLTGGHWTFRNCSISHLVVTGGAYDTAPAPIRLDFIDCILEHGTFSEGLVGQIHFSGCELRHCTFDSPTLEVRLTDSSQSETAGSWLAPGS